MKTPLLFFILCMFAFPTKGIAVGSNCETFNNEAKALFNQSREKQKENKFTEAITSYEKLVTLTPPDGCTGALTTLGEGLYQLMQSYIFNNQREAALQYFTRLYDEQKLWIVRNSPRDIEICLAYTLYQNTHTDRAVALIDKTLERPDANRDSDLLYADYGISAVIYNQARQIQKAIECSKKSIAILREKENNASIVFALGNLIWQYQQAGDFENSIATYEELLNTEAAKTNLYGLAAAEVSVIDVYREWGLDDEMRLHIDKAIDTARRSEVPEAFLRAFMAGSITYLFDGNINKAEALLDSMTVYMPAAGDNSFYTVNHDQLTRIFALINSKGKDPVVIADALALKKEIQQNPQALFSFSLCHILSTALAEKGELDEAIDFYNSYLDYFKENNSLNDKQYLYSSLADLYTRAGRYDKASQFYKLATEAKARFTERRNAALLSQFRVKYETREKEQANKLLQSEVQLKQRTLEYRTSALIALLLLGSVFALWFLMRQRTLKLQHEADRRQHELDEARQKESELIIAEKERQMRQMLSERQEINRKNEELREELERSDAKNTLQDVINRLAPRLLTIEEEQDFRRQFAIIHPAFLPALREFCSEITRSEELLAMLIRLNLTSEEIALALGNNRASVHSSRSRLRKKLNLDKDISLEQFFSNL